MKILICPEYLKTKAQNSYVLTKELISGFLTEDFVVGVCGSKGYNFSSTSFYESPKPKKRFLRDSQMPNRYYEEYLYNNNYTSYPFFKEDLMSITHAISQFQPDAIFAVDRISAIIAGRQANIPIYTNYSYPITRNYHLPLKYWEAVNKSLLDLKLIQFFNANDIYKTANARFVFSSYALEPLYESSAIYAGNIRMTPPVTSYAKRVTINLSGSVLPERTILKVIRDSFLGSSYQVYVYYDGVISHDEENIRFRSSIQYTKILKDTCVYIHSGNSQAVIDAISFGIPQLIIPNQDYCQRYNALNIDKKKLGIMLTAEQFTVKHLYEAFRILVDQDRFKENAIQYSHELSNLGGMKTVIQVIKKDWDK